MHWAINTPDVFRQWEQLDVNHVIPGNGPVVDKSHLTQLREYYENVLAKLYELKKEGMKERHLLKRTDFPEYPGKNRMSWVEGSRYHTKVVTDTLRFWYRQVLKEPGPVEDDLMFIS
jgi:hypothetical protein